MNNEIKTILDRVEKDPSQIIVSLKNISVRKNIYLENIAKTKKELEENIRKSGNTKMIEIVDKINDPESSQDEVINLIYSLKRETLNSITEVLESDPELLQELLKNN